MDTHVGHRDRIGWSWPTAGFLLRKYRKPEPSVERRGFGEDRGPRCGGQADADGNVRMGLVAKRGNLLCSFLLLLLPIPVQAQGAWSSASFRHSLFAQA